MATDILQRFCSNLIKNGDVSALLLELCGGSMFDLLRDAYLIPKKFHGNQERIRFF